VSGPPGGAPEADPQALSRAETAIGRLRDNIDSVDTVLVKLLNQRAKWALEIGDVKKSIGLPIYQPDREARVLARVIERSRGPLAPDAIRRLFERIIDENRRLERLGAEGVAVQGSTGDGGAESGSGEGLP